MKRIPYIFPFIISYSYAGPMPGVDIGGILMGVFILFIVFPLLACLFGTNLLLTLYKYIKKLNNDDKYLFIFGLIIFIFFLIKIWFFSWFLGVFITLCWYMVLSFKLRKKEKQFPDVKKVSFSHILVQDKVKK